MQIRYLKSLLLFSSFATSVYAATYNVTSSADSGANTLRDAINQVNAASDTAATINFLFGVPSTITLASNLPAIVVPNSHTVIANPGAPATIDGAVLHQPFVAYNGGTR